jgi:3-phenylpropionate/trans-cinnamate dioxygenase ferredoxin reductase component
VTGRTIVVVGASLAGFRAAEELRTQGFDGRLVIIGDEPHRPYDRPPLSKDVLAGKREPAAIGLDVADPALDLAAEWELGVRATALDASARRVTLDDGRELAFDGCVVATGAVPRRLPGWTDRPGLHVLRTLDDCLALRADLDAEPSRVVVVGAGFIGAEVAATARSRGLEVTMVEPLPAPVARALGERMGGFVADVHRDHGVDVRLGIGVEGLAGDAGTVAGVRLSDGSVVAADVVVVGIGVRPATDWLEGSGLRLDDGVVCDATSLAAPGVVAAGDLARSPLDGPGAPTVRIEHWDNAVEQGAHAARTLLADLAGGTGEPFAPVPWFWSDQYDRKLQLAGRASADCDVEVVAGSLEDRRFTALYGRAGRLVAALGVNMPAQVARWRNRLKEGVTPFEEAVAEARA